MNRVFEKIMERLKEEKEYSYADFDKYVNMYSPCLDSEYDDFFHRGLERAMKIVHEVDAEYNNGWVPCSDTQKCPNVSKWCARYFWVTLRRTSSKILFTEKLRWIGYLNRWEWCNGRELSNDYEVIAWREYFSPEPYKQKGE